MSTYSKKTISGILLGLCCLATSATVSGKTKEPVQNLPKTEAEFEKWLIGTEWCVRADLGKETKYSVRRFYPKGVMKFHDGKKWDEDEFISVGKYSVKECGKFQYGVKRWVLEIDKDFEGFKGEAKPSKKCKGVFVRRFSKKQ
ncbi:hypothetical protein P4B35_23870 [Pontiellaceae bacterium B12227]|nr:hypothetical protein [Pontiellaceae bacterium B12227]